MERLYKKEATGKITPDQSQAKGEKYLAKAQKACAHNRTTYDEKTGITWCANDACHQQIS